MFVRLSLKSGSSFYRQRVIELLKKLFIRLRIARHHAAAAAAKARRRNAPPAAAGPAVGSGAGGRAAAAEAAAASAAAVARDVADTCDDFVRWLGSEVR